MPGSATILLGWHASPDEAELVRAQLGLPPDKVLCLPGSEQVPFPYGADAGHYLALAPRADAIMSWVLPEEVVRAATALRFVSWLHAGADRLPFALLRDRGITVANVLEAHQPVIAEHAWALLLACAKKIVSKHQAHLAGRAVPYWQPAGVSGHLDGQVLCIIGLGSIGRRIARTGLAFGMQVCAVRNNPRRHDDPGVQVFGPGQLREALRSADYVVLAAPSTPATRGMIGRAELAAMKPTACLVNIARGDLVNEADLRDALEAGRIAGFASDVWWDYPDAMPPGQHFAMPSRLGIHLMPQVVISGDQASNTFYARDRMIDAGIANMRAFLSGRQPAHVVDLALGY